MTVRIAKIKTAAAALPARFALDGNAGGAQSFLPRIVALVRDRETEVVRTATVVRRNHASRHRRRLERAAPLEEQQHLPTAGVQPGKAMAVARDDRQAERVAIKCHGAREIVDVEDGLHDSFDARRLGHAANASGFTGKAILLATRPFHGRNSSVLARLALLAVLLALPLRGAERAPLIAEALAAEARWDSRRALELFLRADREQPNDAFVLQKISKQYSDLAFGEKSAAAKRALASQALTYAQRSVALAPDDAVCALSLAICHGHLALAGSVREKVELSRVMQAEIEHALRLDPNYAWAHHLLGRWHRELADLGRATRLLARLFYGELPRASLAESVAHLRRAAELQPGEASHWIELGFSLEAAGARTEARACWQRGLALPATGPHDESERERARAALRAR